MRNLQKSLEIAIVALAMSGCSAETQREAGEALEQTGQAVESAAKDAANITKGAVEGASRAIDENQEKPDVKTSDEVSPAPE